jgi:heme/copper-type cytochrome/quinol oxidase subunit 2
VSKTRTDSRDRHRRAVAILIATVLVAAGAAGAVAQEEAAEPAGESGGGDEQPTKTIKMIAENWKWSPDQIRVKKGTKVVLVIEGWDAPHSFVLKAFGVKAAIPEGKKTTVTFVADKVGEFSWKCGRPCGNGCPKMKGKLTVLE